jgi:hypothetical protein
VQRKSAPNMRVNNAQRWESFARGSFAALNSMEELAFTCGGDFARIAAEVEDSTPSAAFGDARVSVWVKSADFEAMNDLWVMHKAFASFCHALVRLEATRKGEAKLMSASPGELDLTIRAISPLGAMAVEGTCGYPAAMLINKCLQPRLGNPRAAEARR